MDSEDVGLVVAAGAVNRRRLLAFVLLLRKRRSIRCRGYVTCNALRTPSYSQWNHFYRFADDVSFIATTSLMRLSFQQLLGGFSNYYSINTGSHGGRPCRLLNTHEALGCLLSYYSDTIGYKNLSQLFCIPPATLSRVIDKAEDALAKALDDEPMSRVAWPSLREQSLWAQKVERKCPLVKGRWGFIDGKNYRVQTPTDHDLQNAYYNGCLHSVFVTGSICFGVDGTIVWYRHNCPGSWNDGETSRRFQIKFCREDINLEGHGVLSDSAFPVSGALFGRIVTPLKEGDLERAQVGTRATLAALSSAITSMRQAAEWGMGSVEKPYRRLLETLPYQQRKRGRRLRNLFRLYNFRVRSTGISQIRSYFDSPC